LKDKEIAYYISEVYAECDVIFICEMWDFRKSTE